MKLFLLLATAIPVWSLVTCGSTSTGTGNTWASGVSWDGTTRLTCTSGSRPYWYKISVDATFEALSSENRLQHIQEVFNDLHGGDTVMFQAGHVFSFGHSDNMVIIHYVASGTVNVISTEDAKMPPDGTRITPAYRPLMPIFRYTRNRNLFGCRTGYNVCQNIRMRGLWFEPDPSLFQDTATHTLSYGFIKFGDTTSSGYNRTTLVNTGANAFYQARVRTAVTPGAGVHDIPVYNSTNGTAATERPVDALLNAGDKILIGSAIGQINISNVVVSSNVGTLTSSSAHALAVGDSFTVGGATTDTDLNGTYVVATAPTSTTLTIATSNVSDGTYTFNSSTQPLALVYPHYTVASMDTTLNARKIVVVEDISATIPLNAQIYLSMGNPNYTPSNIEVRHCVFANPGGRHQVNKIVQFIARNVTFADNWLSYPLSYGWGSLNVSDTNGIFMPQGPGPHTITNNYVDGGTENLFTGGSGFNSEGWDPSWLGTNIFYNYFPHYPERDYFGPWTLTQDTGAANDVGTIVTRSYSHMSLNGLSAYSPRLVFAGRIISPATGATATKYGHTTGGSGNVLGYAYFALNTGVVGTTEPTWGTPVQGNLIYDVDPARTNPAIYGTTECGGTQNGDGVCWYTLNQTSGTTAQTFKYRPFIKNNFELKEGKNFSIRWNVFDWFGSMKYWNANQTFMINLKAEGSASSEGVAACDAGHSFPRCYRGKLYDITFSNNVLRRYSGGLVATGATQTSPPVADWNGNYTIENNLFVMTERPVWDEYWIYYSFLIGQNTGSPPTGVHSVLFRKNTIYTPFVWNVSNIGFYAIPVGTLDSSGNIWHRVSGGSLSWDSANTNNLNDNNTTDVVGTWFPKSSGTWGINVILGAATASYPSPTPINGCASAAACVTTSGSGFAESPELRTLHNAIFRRPNPSPLGLGGIFAIKPGHAASRVMPDGSDAGAKQNDLPRIANLNVDASDRAALFTWLVTPAISGTPCVLELHNSPDMETYNQAGSQKSWHGQPAGWVAELSDMSTYFGREADTWSGYIRSGLSRMIALGDSVPLSPETDYFYRLHCGGDVAVGSFRTAAALSGSTTLTHGGESLTWGLAYDRNTDSITSSGSGVSVSVPRGSVVYYRCAGKPAKVTIAK